MATTADLRSGDTEEDAMTRMTEEDAWAFLEAGSRPATFATVRPDGRPHAVPTWYAVDEREIVFTTWHTSVKARNLRANSRVAVVVQDPEPPFSYVAVEGEAVLIDDLDLCRRISTILGGKYMGADRAEAFGRRNGVEGELVVRVRPTHIHGIANLAD
jgi:PPOX class probable F420-dependent enzyme